LTSRPARVVLDTGEDAGLLLNTGFQQANKGLFTHTKSEAGSGLGGRSTNMSAQADAVSVAYLRLTSVPVMLNLDTKGNLNANGDAGLIGGAILDRLHIRFDYVHSWFAAACAKRKYD
jgi:hypothetical protein